MGGKFKEFSQFISNDDYPLALFDPTQFHSEFFERNNNSRRIDPYSSPTFLHQALNNLQRRKPVSFLGESCNVTNNGFQKARSYAAAGTAQQHGTKSSRRNRIRFPLVQQFGREIRDRVLEYFLRFGGSESSRPTQQIRQEEHEC